MSVLNVGLVGCGMIRRAYLQACGESRWLELAACADLLPERARQACGEAAEHGWGTPRACTFEEMLGDPEIGLVLNITNPRAHYPVSLQALEAGKHVFLEKPLSVLRDEGAALLAAARAHHVTLGCAPDTFLGAGHQTARALLDAGAIGVPSSVTLFFAGPGPDGFHQDPELFFQAGAGPMLDIGVYVLTHVVHYLGPVKRVCGFTKITFPERTVLSEKKRGQTFAVEVPTHVTASLEFANGVLGTFLTSFDIKGRHRLPHIEVYGTEGSLSMGDPNVFSETPKLFRPDAAEKEWQDVEATHGYAGGCRGIGAADLAAALHHRRPPRAGGALAQHVLDIALSIYESAASGSFVEVASTAERPALMPAGVTADITD